MTINLSIPTEVADLKPRITVVGVGGAGGNAVNNMIRAELIGCEFVACNTDAQALKNSLADRHVQLGQGTTRGLGAGSRPDVGRKAAEEAMDEIMGHLQGSNMVFITAGMGGGTGTGAAPVIARTAREHGILTVGVITKPFAFEGTHRMRLAESGIEELQKFVDTLLIIPNQNLFRVATEKTTFAEAFKMADDVLYAGVRGVTDLMVKPGMINLDFADIRAVMGEMGKAMMGTGEAAGANRALEAAEAAISNPLLDDVSMKGARGVLINITGGSDMTLFEVDAAAKRISQEVDPEANIIFGSTTDENLDGKIRISVVATGIDAEVSRRAAQQNGTGERRQPVALHIVPQTNSAMNAASAAQPSPAPEIVPEAEPAAVPLFARTPSAPVAATAAEINRAVAEPQATGFAASRATAPVAEPMTATRTIPMHEPMPQRRQPAPSLFQRFIGGGRAAQPAPAPQRPQSAIAQPRQAVPNPPAVPRLAPVADLAIQPGGQDYLEIPAFLRRNPS